MFFYVHRYFLPCACAGLLFAAPIPVDIGQAKGYFDEARAACEADGGRLWGLSLCGPLMFVERQSRLVVANQPDGKGVLKQQDGAYVGALPGGERSFVSADGKTQTVETYMGEVRGNPQMKRVMLIDDVKRSNR